MEIFVEGKLKRFKYFACLRVVFLATFFTVVFGKRERCVYQAYECFNSSGSWPEKLPVIMLHGVSNTKETWDGIYQKIDSLTGRKVCIYDARNHGDSSWNNTFDTDILPKDLECLMDKLNIRKASLIGHSMGGFIVMKFALNNPSKVESIIVEDMTPKARPPEIYEGTVSLFRVLLESISSVNRDSDQKTVVKVVKNYVLKATGKPAPEYLFKRFPFRREHDRWQWKANFELFIRAAEDPALYNENLEGLFEGEAFFIYGKASAFRIIDDKEYIRALFPRAKFFGVDGAQHEIHEYFPVFSEKVIEFLNKQGHQSILKTDL